MNSLKLHCHHFLFSIYSSLLNSPSSCYNTCQNLLQTQRELLTRWWRHHRLQILIAYLALCRLWWYQHCTQLQWMVGIWQCVMADQVAMKVSLWIMLDIRIYFVEPGSLLVIVGAIVGGVVLLLIIAGIGIVRQKR